MIHYSRNKNELLVLTASVYAFVAYLTAFTLEVLFIVDLARQNNEQLAAAATTSTTTASNTIQNNANQQFNLNALDAARFTLDSMQTHVTTSCLAISILYFILFVASLTLIVAFIIKSTFMLLIWMCVMTTTYLPEFGLIIYVSFHVWGIDTRNGQTEFIFYLFRAVLNVIFIFKAHKLYKEWKYEKNFFRLKSASNFTGYDSPYFIGDSLTTTINPVFSSSTLNLTRYDHVRDFATPQNSDNIYADCSGDPPHNPASRPRSTGQRYKQHQYPATTSFPAYARSFSDIYGNEVDHRHKISHQYQRPQSTGRDGHNKTASRMQTSNSVSSLNDNDSFVDCDLNLDYGAPTTQRYVAEQPVGRQQSSGSRYHANEQHSSHSDNLSYSTQSLDRRHLKDMDFAIPEQVILRPLGHQPFEYLRRPGSTTILNSSPLDQSNTQPATFHSNNQTRSRNIDKRYVNQIDWTNGNRFI